MTNSTDSTIEVANGSPSSESINGLSNGSTGGIFTSSTDENRESSSNTGRVRTDFKHDFNGDVDLKAVERLLDNTRSQATRLFFLSAVDEVAGQK